MNRAIGNGLFKTIVEMAYEMELADKIYTINEETLTVVLKKGILIPKEDNVETIRMAQYIFGEVVKGVSEGRYMEDVLHEELDDCINCNVGDWRDIIAEYGLARAYAECAEEYEAFGSVENVEGFLAYYIVEQTLRNEVPYDLWLEMANAMKPFDECDWSFRFQ